MDERRERRGIRLKLSGKDKAQLLLTVLGDKGKLILDKLSPEASNMLMSEVGSAPKKDPKMIAELLKEIQLEIQPLPTNMPSTVTAEKVETTEATSNQAVEDAVQSAEQSLDMQEEEDDGIPRDSEGNILREIPDIAQILTEQSPQIIAFILSRIDDEMKAKIMEYIPEYLSQELREVELDILPIGEHVYRNLYHSIFVMPKDMPQEDEEDPLSLF